MSDFAERFGFFDPTQEYSVTYGTLPHWEQSGATYFITYRTNDSIPRDAVELWKRKCEDERSRLEATTQPWQNFEKLDWDSKRDFHRKMSTIMETELDQLHGNCELRQPNLSLLVADNLLYHQSRYELGGFVVMPNHVHVLVCFHKDVKLLDQCYNWKHFTSRVINKQLGLRGHFWQSESFDHLVRNVDHFQKFRKYMQDNGPTAGLSENEYRVYLPDLGIGDL